MHNDKLHYIRKLGLSMTVYMKLVLYTVRYMKLGPRLITRSGHILSFLLLLIQESVCMKYLLIYVLYNDVHDT